MKMLTLARAPRRMLSVALTLFAAAAPVSPCFAVDGVTNSEILLGTSFNLSGPGNETVRDYLVGTDAYLKLLNAKGGVHGRKVRVVTYDDQNDPKAAIANTEKLLTQDKVLALFNYFGTQNAKSVLPAVNSHKVPFLFPHSGAAFLRKPVDPYVFTLRPSHEEEGRALVKFAVDQLKLREIGILVQNDDLGNATISGVIAQMREAQIHPVEQAKYQRNFGGMNEANAALVAKHPAAVVLAAHAKPTEALITAARAKGWSPVLLGITISFNESVGKALAENGDIKGYFLQSFPLLTQKSSALIQSFQADMKAAGSDHLNQFSLEGYVGARVLGIALQKAGATLTRESLLKAMESVREDLGGLKVAFAPDQHQGVQELFLTRAEGGALVKVEK